MSQELHTYGVVLKETVIAAADPTNDTNAAILNATRAALGAAHKP